MYDEQGKKTGVIISAKDFEKNIEKIENWIDYKYIQKYGDQKTKLIPFEKVFEKLEKKLP